MVRVLLNWPVAVVAVKVVALVVLAVVLVAVVAGIKWRLLNLEREKGLESTIYEV